MKPRRILTRLWLVAIVLFATAVGLGVHERSLSRRLAITGELSRQDVSKIQRAVLRGRWAQLRRSFTTRNFKLLGSSLRDLAVGRISQVGPTIQSDAGYILPRSAYVVTEYGRPCSHLSFTYILEQTTNDWRLVHAYAW